MTKIADMISKLEMLQDFDIKESYIDDYVEAIEKYKEDVLKIKAQNLSKQETIKLIDKLKLKITDYVFDYNVIYEMLKAAGKEITLAEVKKYLSLKLK
jgi:hypothetical protein